MELKVISKTLGTYKVPVIYINTENESFCAHHLMGKANISHLIHVRYGGSCGGGGYASGVWMRNVLKALSVEVYITDEHVDWQSGDHAALKAYPNLRRNDSACQMETYKVVPGENWSNHGDVNWKKII